MKIKNTKQSPPTLIKGKLAQISKYELQSTGKEALIAQYQVGHSISKFVSRD
jgi:hypothetical protein